MSNKNPPYARCEYCSATLDKGERCDCEESRREPRIRLIKTPEEEQEAAERKAWVIANIGRRASDCRE